MIIDEAKAQAKALRAALQAQGNAISHAQALELVARQHGAKDWNTLHARMEQHNAPPELGIGDRVRGRYLGQVYLLHHRPARALSTHRQIEIRFDHPVDVVRVRELLEPSQPSPVRDRRKCSLTSPNLGRRTAVDRRERERVKMMDRPRSAAPEQSRSFIRRGAFASTCPAQPGRCA